MLNKCIRRYFFSLSPRPSLKKKKNAWSQVNITPKLKTDDCKINSSICSRMSLLPLCTNNALSSRWQAFQLTLWRATAIVELVAPSSTVCHLEPDSGLRTIASQSCTSHSSLVVQLGSICSTFCWSFHYFSLPLLLTAYWHCQERFHVVSNLIQ